MCGVDCLAKGLVGPTAVVADGGEGLGEIFFEGDMVWFTCVMLVGEERTKNTARYSGDQNRAAFLVHTIIPCIDTREQVLVLLDEIGQSGHQLAALCRGHQLPRWMHQGLLGGLDGAIRVFGASRMDGGNGFISPGIADD